MANLEILLNAPQPTGSSIAINTSDAEEFDIEISMIQTANGLVSDQVGLILPTSLCSGQVAAMIAKYLNEKRDDQSDGLSRFVSLAHTEGCGASSGQSEELAIRTMVGYILHPADCQWMPVDEYLNNEFVGDFNKRIVFQRLIGLLEEVDIPVWSWHADISSSQKRRLIQNPSGVLQITPEVA